MDFGEIVMAAEPVLRLLDHRTLNDVPGLENPTSELLAHWLWRRLRPALPALSGVKDRVAFGHQTGPRDLEAVRRAYAEAGFAGPVAEPYFDDMPARIGWADLVIARAGATTCAELIAAGRASILIPFAGAAVSPSGVSGGAGGSGGMVTSPPMA